MTLRYGVAEDGGAILNSESSSLTVVSSRIVSNTAERYGGGIANFNSTTITNSFILSNTADDFAYSGGGGIYTYRYGLNIINSTIAGNKASKGGGR